MRTVSRSAGLLLIALAPCASEVPASDAAPAPIASVGRWVLDAEGKAVAPREFERGLQSSALVYGHGVLWSVGDQRSEYPGHVFRIDPERARISGKPLRVEAAGADLEKPLFRDYFSIRNPDFEGLAWHPLREDALLVVTEDKRQTILDVQLERPAGGGDFERARLRSITELDFPAGVAPYREDMNYRLEGVAASKSRRRVYLAYERLANELPALFALSVEAACAGGSARPERLAINFAALPRRADKEKTLLNINGLELIDHGGKELLLAVARDQERLVLIDPEAPAALAAVDLRLLAPGEREVFWVSPEGLAIDAAHDRLWLINDPDSIRGNFRLAAEEKASGRFAELAPLLFELKLSTILDAASQKRAGDKPSTSR
jgi:uncharacterized protein YjiK